MTTATAGKPEQHKPEQQAAARATTKSAARAERPAADAATRVSRAGLIVGGLGLVSALFIMATLLDSWRVAPGGQVHDIRILGLRMSYPAANAEGILVLLMAAVGAIVIIRLVGAAVREARASRRFHRRLSESEPDRWRGAFLVHDSQPRAFCAGLIAPRVYLSTGALELLDSDALMMVLAHEFHHARRRDPLRLAVGRVLERALGPIPGLPALLERQRALAELSADESAVGADAGNRSALARAMLGFSDAAADEDAGGIDPARVDYLLGEPPSWRFPSLLFLAAVGILAVVIATAALAGQVASGSATLALPVLSHQPCIVLLAAVPTASAVLAGVGGHRWMGRRRSRTDATGGSLR